MILRERKYRQAEKGQGEDVHVLPFKDNHPRSQVPTLGSTLTCTSDQFRSSWSQITPEDADGFVTGRRTPPIQPTSCKPSFLLKLILAPVICPYPLHSFYVQRYHRCTRIPLPKEEQQKECCAGPDLHSRP